MGADTWQFEIEIATSHTNHDITLNKLFLQLK